MYGGVMSRRLTPLDREEQYTIRVVLTYAGPQIVHRFTFNFQLRSAGSGDADGPRIGPMVSCGALL